MSSENVSEESSFFGNVSGTFNFNDAEKESNNDSISKIKLKLEDIQEAHKRNKNKIVVTPIVAAKSIGKNFCNVLFKCENLQITGSFKARGTFNTMTCMTPAEKAKGCTVSGGRNFLTAITHSGYKESIPVNVVIPRDTPLVDRQKYKENYAILKVYGNDLSEASLHALTYCNEIGSHFVRGSDRLDLLAGYGTVGLEILSQVDRLDAIICPVGTGGLVASLLLAVKSLKPNCLIYGVESLSAPTMTKALQEKRPIMVPVKPTVADSIADNIASNNAFNIIKRYLNKMITVDEMWISRAVLNLLEREKILVEPAAASPAAAIMAGKVPELRGKNVVCILTGGNINLSRLPRTVDRGLMAEGRLIVFSVSLPDSPYAVARLLAKVVDTGAGVRSFEPERSWIKRDSINMTACMLIETSDANHAKELEKKLLKDYPLSQIITVSLQIRSRLEASIGYRSCTVQDDLMMESEKPHVLSFTEIKQAAERIEDGVIHTPLCEAKISKYMDYNIYLKCDNLQYTGSCAERGIRNAFVAHNDIICERGVIVPSNGNMALGAAYHGSLLHIPVTVVLPERSPPSLSQRCAELGADVVLCGDNLEDAVNYAYKANRDGRQILLNSDDPLVMAGVGTVGVEIITQLPEADAVIVPVAAGGLLAATLVACKKLKCTCLVYGAECAKVPKMMKALQAGHPVSVPVVPNLAQGLSASIVGENAFATIKGRLDRMLVVDEAYIARAVINVLERERLVADGAGVCALAAVMQGLVPELRGKRAVCVISGGNVDPWRLSRTIQRGLGVSGRLMRFAVPVPDHCKGLEVLAKAVADERAVIKSLGTEQMWVHSDIESTWANVVVETANEDNASALKERLRDIYPTIRFAVFDVDDKHKLGIR